MKNKLGFVVPYRDRKESVKNFLFVIRKHMKGTPFHVFIIEQIDGKPFNRGKLSNVGYLMLPTDITHVVFHDVDLLPAESAIYPVDNSTFHVSSEAEQHNFSVPYDRYFGGVQLFPVNDFKAVNGFGNEFYGWGAEDDDLRNKCDAFRVGVKRVPNNVFFSTPHEDQSKEFQEINKTKLINNSKYKLHYIRDGLNSCKYKVIETINESNIMSRMIVNI